MAVRGVDPRDDGERMSGPCEVQCKGESALRCMEMMIMRKRRKDDDCV